MVPSSPRGLNPAATSARPAGPAGTRPGSAGYSVKSERVQLARVNASGASNATGTAIARINNPSRRLSCSVSVAFEPDSPQAIPNYAGATYTLTAMRPGTNASKEARLHTILAATALPHAYEMDTAIRAIEVSAALTIPLTAGAAAIPGDWVLVVEWEPNQNLCIEDYEAQLARASAYLARGPSAPLAP